MMLLPTSLPQTARVRKLTFDWNPRHCIIVQPLTIRSEKLEIFAYPAFTFPFAERRWVAGFSLYLLGLDAHDRPRHSGKE